jgi:NADH-quinone oxidoreductase subunit E
MVIHWAQVFGAAGLGGFRLLPVEGHVVTVCTCAACRFAGGESLLRETERLLGVRAGESTPDGSFTLETSADVAAGAIAPAVRIDTLVYGPLTPEHLVHLLDQRRGAAATIADGGNGKRRRAAASAGKR